MDHLANVGPRGAGRTEERPEAPFGGNDPGKFLSTGQSVATARGVSGRPRPFTTSEGAWLSGQPKRILIPVSPVFDWIERIYGKRMRFMKNSHYFFTVASGRAFPEEQSFPDQGLTENVSPSPGFPPVSAPGRLPPEHPAHTHGHSFAPCPPGCILVSGAFCISEDFSKSIPFATFFSPAILYHSSFPRGHARRGNTASRRTGWDERHRYRNGQNHEP